MLEIVVAGLMLYLIVVPLLPVGSLAQHNWARQLQLPLMLIAVVTLAMRDRACSTLGMPRWPSLLLLPLGVLACLVADMPAIAFRELVLVVGLACLAICVAQGAGRVRVAAAVIVAWTLYGAVYLLMLCLILLGGQPLDGWLLVYGLGFDSPRFLNHAQSAAIPLLLGALDTQGLGRRLRGLAWFALASSFMLLAVTLGRATIVALTVSCLLATVLFGTAGRRYLQRALWSAVVGIALYVLFFHVLSWVAGLPVGTRLAGTLDAASAHARFYLWQLALGFIADFPWLGIGPMHYSHHFNGEAAHPHNVYLQVAAEYGLPFALLLLAWALWALTVSARRLRRLTPESGVDPLAVGAFSACVAAMIDGFFSGNFVMPVSQMWIVLAVGMLMALVPRAEPAAAATRRSWLAWRALLLLILGAMLWLTAVSIRESRQAVPTVGGGQPVALDVQLHFSPRFWLHGWF
jgi:O-antigen ligase